MRPRPDSIRTPRYPCAWVTGWLERKHPVAFTQIAELFGRKVAARILLGFQMGKPR